MHELLLSLPLLFLVACQRGPAEVKASQPGSVPVPGTTEVRGGGGVTALENRVRAVRCGCRIEGIGQCGNYIEIGGRFLPLTGDLGLGPMHFCDGTIQKGRVSGQVAGQKFVATSFADATHQD